MADAAKPGDYRNIPGGATLAGLVGPPLYGLATAVSGWLRPGYDPIRQHISDLGIGAWAWVQNSATIGLGLLLLILAWGLRQELTGPRDTLRRPALLIGGCGVGAVMIGLIPVDAATASRFRVGAHTLAVGLCVSTMLAAALLVAVHLRHDPNWRACARWSGRYAGFVAVALPATLILGAPLLACWGGLLERLLIIGGLGWLECFMLGYLRLPSPQHRAQGMGAAPRRRWLGTPWTACRYQSIRIIFADSRRPTR